MPHQRRFEYEGGVMDGLLRLLEFADYLRARRMPFLLQQIKDDAVTLTIGTFGNRFQIDFFEDRASLDWYKGDEEASGNLRAIQGLIDAAAGADPAPAHALEPADHPVSQQPPGGMRRLLELTARLRRSGIAYAIEQQSGDSIEVSFIAQGRRLEVEFFADGVLCSHFAGRTGIPFDLALIQEEIEGFNRPFLPPADTREPASGNGAPGSQSDFSMNLGNAATPRYSADLRAAR